MNTISTPKTKAPAPFSRRLLDWYHDHAREMPWRIPPDEHAKGVRQNPYRVWLSEIMLQQTQVVTVREYFLKFVSAWPSVHALAAADREDVLRAWAGLGYYSRARNLKKCAEIVSRDFAGTFPDTVEELKKLPGIGEYTAAAIASICFDRAVPVIDGNIERVMSRHGRISTPFPEAKTETRILLNPLLDKKSPGEFAQAMMDLGAMVCTPKKPSCPLCPISEDCRGLAFGDAESYPRKLPKRVRPKRSGSAFAIFNERGEIFLCKRPEQGLLAGMTQIPTSNWSASRDGDTSPAAAPIAANWTKAGVARHTFTHFQLDLMVYCTRVSGDIAINGWWCDPEQVESEAIPKVMLKAISRAVLS